MEEVQEAIETAEKEPDFKASADLFGKLIVKTVDVNAKNQKESALKWTTKLAGFLKKLFPITRLSLRLIGAFSEVDHYVLLS